MLSSASTCPSISDRTAVSKLIGATAGYVGYEDNSNTLTERVRRNPYSIVLSMKSKKADPSSYYIAFTSIG